MFIHGLGGDAFKTWSNDKNHEKSWPFWLGEAFPDVGVWSIGYASSPSKLTRVLGWFSAKHKDAGQTMPLPDRALQLLNQLQQRGIGERPILFICHSLGGLMAKQILRSSVDVTGEGPRETAMRKVSANTRAVLFLATPHNGAALASMLNAFRAVLGTTVSITDLKLHDAHLRELFNWYRNHSPKLQIETITYYEGRSVGGALPIVNETSGHPGIGADPLMLDEGHISIAKPNSTDTDVYLGACSLLRDCVLRQLPRTSGSSHVEALAPTQSPPINVYVDSKLIDKASAARIPHQLPPAAEQYFGRSVEKAKVIARLREGKNTAIVAPAGMGKTALAAEAVRAVVGSTPASLSASPYPGGVVFLDLYETHGSLDQALAKLADSLEGTTFMTDAPARTRASDASRGRRILVIVEGGEEADGIGGHGQIADFFNALSVENCWLLLTRLSTQSASEKSVALKDALDDASAAALLDSLTQGKVTAEVRTRVLALLEGHPLAITWAGNLLARGDEDPARLATDWTEEELPTLCDPEHATRTLEWLFDRSLRGLDNTSKRALAAAGLLARAPFPLGAIAAALHGAVDKEGCRDALRTLVQRGFLQRTDALDRWQFVHVLGYRFARDEKNSEAAIRLGLASWLEITLKDVLTSDKALQTENEVSLYLEHVSALLRADFDRQLWHSLANEVLYGLRDRLTDLQRLGQVNAVLATVHVWMGEQWLRERSLLLHHQGDSRIARGDLAGALKVYQEAVDVRKTLAENEPFDAARQLDLVVSHKRVGKVCLVQGDFAGALTAFQEAADVLGTLTEKNPSSTAWQRDLSESYDMVGDAYFAQHDIAAALRAFRVSMGIRKTMTSQDPPNAEWQRDLRVSYDKVDDAHVAQGNLTEAVAAFQASIGARRALVERDQSNIRLQRDLSLAFTRLAQVHERLGKPTSALELAEKSLQIDERLATLDCNDAASQDDVKFVRAMVARLKAADV